MLENGVLVEGYRIDRLIGEGGMGIVYEATQLSLERKVALKLLSTELSADSGFRERFRHEARIQGALDHPNIVTVHEAGESEYGLFIAMELIRGATLKDLIVGRELDAGRTHRILSQVAEALDSAHDAGLIHRDIKPHNILVRAGRRDHAYLADFGVTKVRGGTNLTKTGHFVGTVDYMAPEQIRGEPATRETDIYALGTVLYECLSGVVPFPKDSDVAVMYAHLADPPPRLTEERPELPPELDAVISTAMAKNPSERYPSAVRMMEAFETALGDSAKAAVTAPRPIQVPQEIGLREDGTGEAAPERPPETAATPARSEDTQAAPVPVQPTPAPPTEVTETPPEAAPSEPEVLVPAAAVAGPPTVAAGTPVVATAAGEAPAVAAPVEAAPPSRGLPMGAVLGIAVAIVGGLAAGGFLVGHSGSKATASSAGGISAGKATVSIPSDWHELKSVPKVAYLPMQDTVAMSPTPGSKDGLILGQLNLSWPYLLPSKFVSHETTVPKTAVVSIGKLQAYRTSEVKTSGVKGLKTVFTFPQAGKKETTTAVCYSQSSSASSLQDCERVVSGLVISDAKLYNLVPSSAYAAKVNSVLKSVSSKQASGLKKLGNAGSSSAQAKAASGIATGYNAGAKQLKSAGPPAYAAPANAKIVSALNAGGRAYTSLASAARSKSSSAYAAAKSKAAKANNQLDSAVAELKSLGYNLS